MNEATRVGAAHPTGHRRWLAGGALALAVMAGAAAILASCADDPAPSEPDEEAGGEALPDPTPTTAADPAPSATPATEVPVGSDPVPCPDELPPGDGESQRVAGDFDGDGRPETLALDRAERGPTVVMICGSELQVEPWDAGDLNRPLQVFVVDVEGDGTDELLAGGVTGTGPFSGNLVRVVGGRFEGTRTGVSVRPGAGESFGCVDVDGDGLRELVRLEYRLVGGETLDTATSLDWTRTVLDDSGEEGPIDEGSFALPEERDAARATIDGTCGEQTLIPLG